ncbi:MAG: nuclear transport factor 2 family protein [Chthoniobacterales bacterium]|nr:nuclear transport factor 2 family protein [Chthoniobacterales bacterium]
MNNSKSIRLVGAALCAAFLVSTTPARAAENNTAAVRAASNQFYTALNQLFTGDMAPMEAIWSHRKDVTYMGPGGGYRVGWDAVRKDLASQAAMKLSGSIKPAQVQINAGSDLASVSNMEVGSNVIGGKKSVVSLRATSIYRKENGQWKMIGHHTDLIPRMAKK